MIGLKQPLYSLSLWIIIQGNLIMTYMGNALYFTLNRVLTRPTLQAKLPGTETFKTRGTGQNESVHNMLPQCAHCIDCLCIVAENIHVGPSTVRRSYLGICRCGRGRVSTWTTRCNPNCFRPVLVGRSSAQLKQAHQKLASI